MIESLNNIDTSITTFINSFHSGFFDFLMIWISNKFIWIPFYAFLLYLIIKSHKKNSILIILFIIILITLSDQGTDFIKDIVRRARPSHEDSLRNLIHVVNNYRSSPFGFFSSHASNSFAVAVFAILFLKSRYKILMPIMISWALIVCYSRVYLGVHYFGDVLCGAIFGSTLAYLMFMSYSATFKLICKK